ncbi:MAG: fumarate reductase subunit FrdD [Pseudomonadota bacterium]|nr:fumarate reductase subunit FrdD [Pseudomonadota bacterium]
MNTPAPAVKPRPFTRSNKPIFWSMFGAGGMLSALIGPMLVFLTLIAIPLGLLLPPETLSHARVLAFVQWWPGKLAVFAVVALFLFHAFHRLYHTLHDFGLHISPAAKALCHGLAGLFSLVCLWLLWQV